MGERLFKLKGCEKKMINIRDAAGKSPNRSEDINGLQEQVILLSDLSNKLDEYFSLPKGGRNF